MSDNKQNHSLDCPFCRAHLLHTDEESVKFRGAQISPLSVKTSVGTEERTEYDIDFSITGSITIKAGSLEEAESIVGGMGSYDFLDESSDVVVLHDVDVKIH